MISPLVVPVPGTGELAVHGARSRGGSPLEVLDGPALPAPFDLYHSELLTLLLYGVALEEGNQDRGNAVLRLGIETHRYPSIRRR